MRRRAILQGIQQETELELGFFGADVQRVEYLALHIGTVNTHRPAAQFPAVQHHVIGLGNTTPRVSVHPVFMAVFRGREGVVHRAPALAVFIVFKHRKVNHPQRLPALGEQAGFLSKSAVADFQAERANAVIDHLGLVSAKEQDVAVLCACARQNFRNCRIVNIFHDRALQAVPALGDVIDLDPGQALGTVNLDKLGVGINFAAADFSATGNAQGHHAATCRGGGRAENLEIDICHHIGQLGEFHADPKIGLVRSEAVHGIGIRHDRELAQVGIQHRLEHVADHALEHVANFLLAHEGRFNVNLREFRLAVSAQVFIAKALGDLVVAVKTGHHQQLLEQLRALRQCKEHAFVDAAGHQVIARTLGRAFGQHGRLDVDKPVGIEKLAGLHGHAVTQHQVVLHVGTAQVEHPVRQTRCFRQVVIVQLEGRRHAGVENNKFVAQHLNFSALQVVIDGAFGAGAHHAFDLHAKLVAYLFSRAKHVGPVRVADHLHVAFAIPQVDEDHAAMVTPAIDPAAQADALPHHAFSHQTAIGRTHLSDLCISNSHKKYSKIVSAVALLFTGGDSGVRRGGPQAPPHPWK